MRRKVVWWSLAAVTLTLGMVMTHLLSLQRRPACGLDAYHAIRLGMTREEAVAVVGVPVGDYTGGQTREYRSETEVGQQEFIPPPNRKYASSAVWVGARGRISLGFDEEGRVWVKNFTPHRGGPPCLLFTWLDRLADTLYRYIGLHTLGG